MKSETITGVLVKPHEEQVAAALASCGVLRLEERVNGSAAVYHWRPYRVRIADGRRDEVRQALGKADPDLTRHALSAAIIGTAELAGEHLLLVGQAARSPLRPPHGSATGATQWTVYEAALRAAVGWYRARAANSPVSARELAATTLGSSKAWTPAREVAFARLINMKFEDAVETIEPGVRLRGPLLWSAGTTIVDAAIATPWAAIPARSAQQIGTLDVTGVRGVLIVENLDTFEAICRHSVVHERWLCLWGSGYVNDSLIGLVQTINRPLACWSDLDAHGVAIVGDIQRRSGLTVHPVFMDVELHSESAFLLQDDEQRRKARRLAQDGHPQLRELADRIAANGLGREQETMHHLIPKLGARLAGLEISTRGQ
ncbi:Wadjet anti-phage system protein JetD domain-containing protein [Micromonospora sp. NPDC006766]|uniref:Wadjet anti-phage system protein JetD domain-containing protein n=1 Tax=Micromonospora sp. NPDC006766 TaxID=3154778 RepID=UPI0033F1ED54